MKSFPLFLVSLFLVPTGICVAQTGTFSPQVSVFNNLNSTAGSNGVSILSGDTASIYLVRSVGAWSDTWWQWTMGADNKLRLGFSTVPQLTFQNGAVGFGTDNPENRLHVGDGDIRISRASGSWGPNLLLDASKVGSGGVLWGIGSTTSNDVAGAGRLTFWSNGNPHFNITSDGNVGVGTATPGAKLEVANSGNATLRVGLSNNASNGHVQVRDSLHTVAYDANSRCAVGALAWNHYNDGNNPSWSGVYLTHLGTSMSAQEYGVANANSGRLIFQNCNNAVVATNGQTPIHISPYGQISTTFTHTGNVGIGVTDPAHKLAVNGTIKAKEVIVETAGWSDYVFADDYTLAPLAEVEAHIKEHKHLPGIPSAAEVSEQGVSIGDMQAKLLAKIEELTLHQIAQEKRGRAQEARAAKQDEEIAALRAQVSHLLTVRP